MSGPRPSRAKRAAAVTAAVILAAVVAVVAVQSCTEYKIGQTRSAEWAQPVADAGIENMYAVQPNVLYRGAQPDAGGMKRLQARGIKTGINLRQLHTDDDEIGDLPLKKVHIPMSAWRANDDLVVDFLKATAEENQPVYVHCRRGADRTGLMIAAWRIAVQGWTRKAAAAEMKHGGFHANVIFDDLQDYLKNMDVDAIRKKAGLTEAPAAVP